MDGAGGTHRARSHAVDTFRYTLDMSKLPIWVLFVSASAFSAAAQSKPAHADLRAKALGEVRTAENRPWVGATVTLVSYPVPEVPGAGEVDLIHVKTDERGRFRAPVLRNHLYSVWASSGLRVSETSEGVVAGKPVLLAEAKTMTTQRYELEGVDAWDKYAPLRVRVVLGTKNPHAIPVTLDDDHGFTLPTIPNATRTIEVLDKDGLARHRQVVSHLITATIAITMKPPKLEHLSVRDIMTEKGLAGATVSFTDRGMLVPIGKTDADGLVRLAVPVGSGPSHWKLFASTPGHAVAALQNGQASQVKSGKWKTLRGVKVARHAHVNAGLRFKGRIMLDKEHPAANLCLILRGQAMHFSEVNARNVATYRRVIRTDKNGNFEFGSCLPEKRWRTQIHAILSPRHIAILPENWRRHLQIRVDDFYPLSVGKTDEVNDLGVLDLSSLCPVRFSVVNDSGQPAAFATLLLSRGETRNAEKNPIGQVAADRMGRALVLMRPGDESLVFIRKGAAIAMHRVNVQAHAGDTAFAEVKIKLAGTLTISGRVLTPEGKPAGGVSIWTTPRLRSGLGEISLPAEETDESAHRPGRNSAYIEQIVNKSLAARIIQSFLSHRITSVTDADGTFRLEVSPYATQYQVYAQHSRQHVNSRVTIDDESVTDLELQLR